MNLGRLERRYAYFPVTVTLADGAPAEPAGVDVMLLARGATLTAAGWTTAELEDGRVRVLLAGPDAEPVDGALTVPIDGADLYARVTDTPEIDTARVERITVS